jgi:hypothetical protein
VLYNKAFKTAISVAFSGAVVVYNIEDGSDCARFHIPQTMPQTSITVAKKDEPGPAKFILQAILDDPEKRLIVLTCYGTVQLWNFICGSMIFEGNFDDDNFIVVS